VVVVRAKLNVNLKAETIEDVIGKRRALHLASLDNLRGELSRDLDDFGQGGEAL
jgi:hypothetical protein